MIVKLIDKSCKQCGKIMLQVSPYKKLCEDCSMKNKKEHIDKMNKNQSENNYKIAYERAKFYIEKYINNEISSTTIKFDEISEVNSRQIIQSFRGKTWVDILTMFNKQQLLKDYIKTEYLQWVNNTNKKSLKDFSEQNKYITYQIIKSFGIREILNYCGRKIYRNNEDDYRNNFFDIKNNLGYIPMYQEFRRLTKITQSNYAKKFGFKGKVYDNIVKMYSSKEEYNEYLERRKIYKSITGKQTATLNKELTTKEQLEIELKTIFDDFYKEYNKYPSIRIFEKISKRDKRTFEEKFNKKFKDICLDFGYDIEDKASAEYILLTKIESILYEKCDKQRDWKWLRSINDFPLWVDGYFPKHNLVIEFDGRQHQEPISKFGGKKAFKTLQQNDNIKNKLIPEHGIKLIRISAFEDWYNEDYLKEILLQNSVI